MGKIGWGALLLVVGVIAVTIGDRALRPEVGTAASQRIAGTGRSEPVARGEVEGRFVSEGRPSVSRGPRQPGSLRGTDVDGGFVVDASGRFVVTPDALDLFEYFFVARGEESDQEIVERVASEIDRRLDPPASDAALALLDRYLDYRHQAEALAAGTDPGRSPAETFEAVVELRRSVFGADADLLFGRDEARTRMALAQREIAADPALETGERAALIEALYAELPERERAARERATAPARLLRKEANLHSLGAEPADLDEHRREAFGDAAAARLAELDRTRAAWNERVSVYQDERDALLAAPRLSERERSDALQALLEENFEGPERLRMEALERISEQASTS
ncbi:MAG: lipase secretion chaperone [Candidatus Binatia bacterium]|nr:lipase secretion chaperone [Candidatus Binatia bacterium]